MDNVKECSKCHEMEAHSRNGSKLQAYCKKCVKAYNAEYLAKPEIESFGGVVPLAIVYQVFEPEKIRIMTHRATMGFNPRIDSLDREGYVVIVMDLYTGSEGG